MMFSAGFAAICFLLLLATVQAVGPGAWRAHHDVDAAAAVTEVSSLDNSQSLDGLHEDQQDLGEGKGSGPFGQDTRGGVALLDADWKAVNKTWTAAFGGSQGVTRRGFTDFFLKKYNALNNKEDAAETAYKAYLSKVFVATAGMGKGCQKTLSGHCFRYAAALAGEFSFGGNTQDRLHLTREERGAEMIPANQFGKLKGNEETGRLVEMDTAWVSAPKDPTGGVTKTDWLNLMNGKYKDVLMGSQVGRFSSFLSDLYDCAIAMEHPIQTALGAHGFKYAAVVASEFYWSA